jgi:hypothetical protein
MPKLLITKNLSNNKKLQIINAQTFIRDSTYIRNTVLPILRSSITNFFNYDYDGDSYSIDDGGNDMYDGGNLIDLNGVGQIYDTESANTFCYTSYPFIYKTTQTSNFTLSVQGDYGSDGSETKYQYQQDFDYQGRKFSIYISESIDNNQDPSIVECFIVYYPNSKPTINFTYTESGDGNGNEAIDVSNLNGQSVTAFYLLISTQPAYVIGSATLFDALKTFVVNATSVSTSNSIGKKLKIIYTAPAGIPVASATSVNVTFGGSSLTHNRENYPTIIFYGDSPQANNIWSVNLNFNYDIPGTWVLNEYSFGLDEESNPGQGPLSIRATNPSTNGLIIPTTGWTYTLGSGPTVTITSA